MDAAEVDPRYTSGLELAPRYRVDFWDYVDPPDHFVEPDTLGRRCSSWRLTGASDVHEALAWVEARRAGRTAVLYVEYEDGPSVGLARLSGAEPADI